MQRDFIFKGGASKRFHTCETLTTQDIAAHSFGVAWFCELLTDGRASKSLIMAALAHDLAEHRTGDIPSPTKRALNLGTILGNYELEQLAVVGLAKYEYDLATGEAFTLKLADMLDGMMFCLKERRLGNTNMDIVFGRFLTYAGEVIQDQQKVEAAISFSFDKKIADDLIHDINKEWRELL